MKTYVVRIDIPVVANNEEEAEQIVYNHANTLQQIDGDTIVTEVVEVQE